jgi:rubrerythrin
VATFYSLTELLGLAIETERSGRQFYEASAVANHPLAELFTILAGEEAKHERTFQALFEKVKAAPSDLPYDWDETKQYLKAITDSKFFLTPDRALALARSARTEVDALEAALQFERETLLFYFEIERLVAAGHHSIVTELINQERIHIRRLSEMRAKLPGVGT